MKEIGIFSRYLFMKEKIPRYVSPRPDDLPFTQRHGYFGSRRGGDLKECYDPGQLDSQEAFVQDALGPSWVCLTTEQGEMRGS